MLDCIRKRGQATWTFQIVAVFNLQPAPLQQRRQAKATTTFTRLSHTPPGLGVKALVFVYLYFPYREREREEYNPNKKY